MLDNVISIDEGSARSITRTVSTLFLCTKHCTVLVPDEEAKTVSLNISFSTKIFITKFEIRETGLACSYGAQPSSFLDSKRNRKYRNFFSAIQTLYRGGIPMVV